MEPSRAPSSLLDLALSIHLCFANDGDEGEGEDQDEGGVLEVFIDRMKREVWRPSMALLLPLRPRVLLSPATPRQLWRRRRGGRWGLDVFADRMNREVLDSMSLLFFFPHLQEIIKSKISCYGIEIDWEFKDQTFAPSRTRSTAESQPSIGT